MNIQPNNLTNQELLRYAIVDNDKGLSEDWAQAVMQRFATVIDELDAERTAHETTVDDKANVEAEVDQLADDLAEECREHNATKAALRELEFHVERVAKSVVSTWVK